MTLSHANDAFFWVIAKFTGLDIQTMFRVHSVASVFMGLVAFGTVYVLWIILGPGAPAPAL